MKNYKYKYKYIVFPLPTDIISNLMEGNRTQIQKTTMKKYKDQYKYIVPADW